jgi:deazaflavin-dependent oxidoreductase (nitroreductase family)
VTEEAKEAKQAPLPPRWFIRLAWIFHRAMYSVTGGRKGLWPPKPGSWGTMRLHTKGRKSGAERVAILGYFEDGPNLVTMAMNGWGKPEPAWWLNAQAQPDATVDLHSGRRAVHVRAAAGEERDRLWAKWREYDTNLDSWASRRPGETAVVVLEPRPDPADPAR